MVKPHEVLQAGIDHMQDRAATYDKPEGERSMEATVKSFNAITGDGAMNSEERGWLFMNILKMVRSQQGDFKLDNYEDGAAYWGLGAEAAHKERSGVKDLSGDDLKRLAPHYGFSASAAAKDCAADELKKLSDSAVKSYEKKQGWKPGDLAGDGGSEVVMITAKGIAMLDRANKKACKGKCKSCKQEWPDEDRIDSIGQNGPTGEHYTDLSIPENWMMGDILKINDKSSPFNGKTVTLLFLFHMGGKLNNMAKVLGIGLGGSIIETSFLEFHDRPNPKN